MHNSNAVKYNPHNHITYEISNQYPDINMQEIVTMFRNNPNAVLCCCEIDHPKANVLLEHGASICYMSYGPLVMLTRFNLKEIKDKNNE